MAKYVAVEAARKLALKQTEILRGALERRDAELARDGKKSGKPSKEGRVQKGDEGAS